MSLLSWRCGLAGGGRLLQPVPPHPFTLFGWEPLQALEVASRLLALLGCEACPIGEPLSDPGLLFGWQVLIAPGETQQARTRLSGQGVPLLLDRAQDRLVTRAET